MENDLTFGYGREALLEAFDRVCNKDDWKMPIDCNVSVETDLDLLESAIIFFTGTTPKFRGVANNEIRVIAAGYYYMEDQ